MDQLDEKITGVLADAQLLSDDIRDVVNRLRAQVRCADNELDEKRVRVRELEDTFRHVHQNAQDGTDACGRCGLDLRDPIHRVEWKQ